MRKTTGQWRRHHRGRGGRLPPQPQAWGGIATPEMWDGTESEIDAAKDKKLSRRCTDRRSFIGKMKLADPHRIRRPCMDPGGPSPSHYGARRPLLCRVRRPSHYGARRPYVEPGGPMWSRRPSSVEQEVAVWSQEALCATRRPSLDPGGPLWNQDSLLCTARRPSVEPGGPPL